MAAASSEFENNYGKVISGMNKKVLIAIYAFLGVVALAVAVMVISLFTGLSGNPGGESTPGTPAGLPSGTQSPPLEHSTPVETPSGSLPPETPQSSGGYPTPPPESSDVVETSPYQPGELTFEEYNAMSGKDQELYFKSFESVEAFFAWYNRVKAEYEAEHGGSGIIIGGDGSINFGDLVGGNG